MERDELIGVLRWIAERSLREIKAKGDTDLNSVLWQINIMAQTACDMAAIRNRAVAEPFRSLLNSDSRGVQ